jgi:tripartite-type tricarboxylate transporter receptor subunit TctC
MAISARQRFGVLAAAMLPAVLAVPAAGQAVGDEFYKGKQVSIVVGFGPGGGYDAYARLLGRHIGNHIPGRPSVVVQNMEGAGSVRASNFVYTNAAKDGTVIAAPNQNMPMYQILGGKAAQFQAEKLQWIGSLVGSNGLLYMWHTSPIRSLEDARKREVPLGGTGTNSDSHIFPTLINKLLGTRFKVINGYAGGSKEIHIAIERGEVEGRGGNSWASLAASNPDWIEQKKVHFIVQIGLKPEPVAALKGVPLLLDLVTDPADKQAVEVIIGPTALGYAYWLAPEVPAARITTLRKAFDDMVKDAAFVADAAKSKMEVRAQKGEDLAAIVARSASMPKAVLERTAQLLEWKN